jgi:hypothetical protein
MKFLRSIVRTACVALVCSTCISSVAAQDDGASSNAQPKPSPWRFYDDFSSKSLKKYKLTKKNGKSPSHPYDFVVIDGDIALSVTVESGLNSDLGGSGNFTERAEISVPGKNAIGREFSHLKTFSTSTIEFLSLSSRTKLTKGKVRRHW